MDFDFPRIYASWPTRDLLIILEKEHQYQPEAVAAAREILATRTITEADRQSVQAEVEEQTPEVAEMPGQVEWKEGMSIFEEEDPFVPSVPTTHWHRIIAIVTGLQVGYGCYQFMARAVRIYAWTTLPIDLLVGLTSIVALVLFLRRKRWGWILTTGKLVYLIIPYVISTIMSLFYGSFWSLPFLIGMLALNGALCYLLWMPDVRRYHSVDEVTARRTLIISAAITVGITICYMMLYRYAL